MALELWLTDRSPEHLGRLVERYAYLCRRGARRFCRPGLDRSDLEQVAAIGLLKACDRYDAALRTPFEAFAWYFVIGELMHHVRDCERLVRPPRRLRELERRWERTYEQLLLELGREPTGAEVGRRMGLDEKTVGELRLYRERAIPESLDAASPARSNPAAYTIEHRDDAILLERALARLTKVERTIIIAFYESGYSQLEIARRLGYSQRDISRLHRSALKKMQPLWVHQAG